MKIEFRGQINKFSGMVGPVNHSVSLYVCLQACLSVCSPLAARQIVRASSDGHERVVSTRKETHSQFLQQMHEAASVKGLPPCELLNFTDRMSYQIPSTGVCWTLQ